MIKQIINITLQTATILSITACQPNQTNSPTATVETSIVPTNALATEGASTSESLPDPAICFTPQNLTPFAFMPDNKKILVRGILGVQIFDLGEMEGESFSPAPQNLFAAALSSDGKLLAWSLDSNTIQLIQVSDGQVLHTLEGHTNSVFKLRFSPAGDKLFSASHDGSVRIWDTDGNELQVIETGGEVLGIGISSDGALLATIPSDGPVALWDLTDNTKLGELGGSGGLDTSDAYFSSDGQYLAADLATGLYLWRLSDRELIWNEVKNSLAVNFSPDGQFLAYANAEDNKVTLSSPDGKQIIRRLEGTPGPIWELIFSPDGSLLAATDGRELRIWQTEDGNLLYIGKASCP
ncbi:MAG TPA: hypothetical protein VJ821_11545 [Anaerolineales bacterium]|nr:hypothetical protein [Anaerolineales bacterium]